MPENPPLTLFAKRFEFNTQSTHADDYVNHANGFIQQQYAKGIAVEDNFFHALSIFLSKENIKQKNGGPFGAVIVRYADGVDAKGIGQGMPQVIGVGANHVFPESDPTAHAEMVAYRDAAERTGSSDLKDAVLFTSCECCPMCLGIANGAGISRISYNNNRQQAAEIAGFSDELQYAIASKPHDENMTSITQISLQKQQAFRDKLGDYDAVVLDASGEIYAHAHSDTQKDPTLVGSLSAVRAACQKAQSFSLPEGFQLITKQKPHLSGLVAADWSRMLRNRDAGNPDDPTKDSHHVDALKIIYVHDTFEQVVVTGNGIRQDSALTYQQTALPDDQRAVPTARHPRSQLLRSAAAVFEQWRDGTSQGEQIRY